MQAKFNMTREEIIFVVRRNIIDYVWKSARLEGIAVTYPDTAAIYNGLGVPGVKVPEIIAVNNLKHAWRFLPDHLDCSMDYPYICRLSQLVSGNNSIKNTGFSRRVPDAIGGTAWKPDFPAGPQAKEELSGICTLKNPTDRGITLMLYLMGKQMFPVGNKSISMLAANQVMISSGCGIISIPIEQQQDFTKMLAEFYESNEMQPLKDFVYGFCIDGIEFEHDLPDEQYDEEELEQ